MALLTTSLLMDLSILVAGLAGLLYWLATKDFGHWRKKGVPYFEPKPFVGNLQDLVTAKTSMGELLMKMYFEAAGKPYMGMFGFHRPILLVRDCAVIKSILVKDFNYFRDRSFSPNESKDPLFTKNLFGMNGSRWRHLRVKLTPTFTSGKMKLMYDFVNECGKEMVQLMEREVQAGRGVVEVREVVARFTTDVIVSCGFGLQGNALRDPEAEFRLVLRKVVEWDLWKGLKASTAFFAPQLLQWLNLRVWPEEITTFTRRVVWEAVEHRRATGLRRKDFLDLLIQLKDKGSLEGEGGQTNGAANGTAKGAGDAADNSYALEGDDFVAQAFVFLAAGFETSSTTQTFALYELAHRPDVQSRLREEVREALRAGGGRLSYDALFALPLMHQVVQETLRLYPVVPFLDRVSVQDYQLPDSDVVLEKGTSVMIPIMGIQRDPEIFPEPNAFKPERFDESQGAVPPFAHLPFGEGPRICIGMRMGLMQVKVGLAHFLNSFSVRPSDRLSKHLEFDPTSFLLASKGGMHLAVTRLPDAVDIH